MYNDPKHIRDHEIKIRVDEATYRLIDAWAEYKRTQRATLARELVLQGLGLLESEDDANQVA